MVQIIIPDAFCGLFQKALKAPGELVHDAVVITIRGKECDIDVRAELSESRCEMNERSDMACAHGNMILEGEWSGMHTKSYEATYPKPEQRGRQYASVQHS